MRAWKHNIILRLRKKFTQGNRSWSHELQGLTFAAATLGAALDARPPGLSGLAPRAGLDSLQV